MLKLSALALLGAMTVTTAARMRVEPTPAPTPAVLPHAEDDPTGRETIAIYYSPLDSTRVAGLLGLGMAYHIALVYTDAHGIGRAASAGPSRSGVAQTPSDAFSAVLASFDDRPSDFGTLIADPRNGVSFVEGGARDHSTQDDEGRSYPHVTVLRGRDLSARWASILRTYAAVGRKGLTYSPVTQNSNSLAGTALRRAGISVDFSNETRFAPGLFTSLP